MSLSCASFYVLLFSRSFDRQQKWIKSSLEYWVMNIIDRDLTVFRDLSSDGYRAEAKFTAGMISPLAFPDLTIDIQQLFA